MKKHNKYEQMLQKAQKTYNRPQASKIIGLKPNIKTSQHIMAPEQSNKYPPFQAAGAKECGNNYVYSTKSQLNLRSSLLNMSIFFLREFCSVFQLARPLNNLSGESLNF